LRQGRGGLSCKGKKEEERDAFADEQKKGAGLTIAYEKNRKRRRKSGYLKGRKKRD